MIPQSQPSAAGNAEISHDEGNRAR